MSSTMVAGAIQLDAFRWMLPREGGMRVPGILFADRPLLERMMSDRTPEQVRNAAHLPGILEASIAMPDAHWGYGLPVGGVVATDPEDGVISPGAVGYDIGCGVRRVCRARERPALSEGACERGRGQLGTLGSGNHFLEVQEVEEVYDSSAAAALGLGPGSVTVMIHCGSRGLGHQVCTDYVRDVSRKLGGWGIQLP